MIAFHLSKSLKNIRPALCLSVAVAGSLPNVISTEVNEITPWLHLSPLEFRVFQFTFQVNLFPFFKNRTSSLHTWGWYLQHQTEHTNHCTHFQKPIILSTGFLTATKGKGLDFLSLFGWGRGGEVGRGCCWKSIHNFSKLPLHFVSLKNT